MPESIEKIPSEIEDSLAEVTEFKIIPYPADYTLQGLYDKWKMKDISVPKFQRQYVWNIIQASRLIESFLMGLPVPGVFLYKDPATNKLTVIDGQQRLRTVFGYIDGIFPGNEKSFRLEGINKKWNGNLFNDLDSHDQLKLKDSVLRATIIEQLDPRDDSSVFPIFERLNTGGTSLTGQEIRNCIYHGVFIDTLNEINGDRNWRKIFGKAKPDERMRDMELVVRFLALYYNNRSYYKPMKKFISDFVKENRFGKRIPLDQIKSLFNNTTKAIYGSLRAKPFNIRAGLNAAVFDSVYVAFAKHFKKIPTNIGKRYQKLIDNDDYLDLVSKSTTDVDVVKKRLETAERILFR